MRTGSARRPAVSFGHIDMSYLILAQHVMPNVKPDYFAAPTDLTRHTVTDENGFTYQYEWWTGHVVSRPEFDATKQIEDCVKRDIEIIYDGIETACVSRLGVESAL